MTEQHHGRVKFEFVRDEMPEFQTAHNPEYFQIWTDGAGSLGHSVSLGSSQLAHPAVSDSSAYYNSPLPDGRPGRWINIHYMPLDEDKLPTSTSPHTAMLTVAHGTFPVDETLENLRGLLAGLSAAAALICGAVLMIVVNRALRPMRRLSREIESLGETELSHRFNLDGVPAELAPMVDRLNGLLERLESAFSRERAFTADVAHELRTPLAGLRTTLEVCRLRPRDSTGYEAAIDKCSMIVVRMQEMVQRLLLLARADSRQLTARPQSIDLRQFLEESWAQYSPRAIARGLSMQWGALSSIFIHSDPDLLRIVIDNLFDNAVSYADAGGALNLATNSDQNSVEILLSNTGSQVAAAEVPSVFDRFWRGDQARSNNGAHCGLGLSLCQRLVRILNGDLTVEPSQGGLFIVHLKLHAAPANQSYPSQSPSISSDPISRL